MREFEEEIGIPAPALDYEPLAAFRASSGKRLTIFGGTPVGAVEFVTSTTFEMEWPPRSGTMQSFPEIDRAEWFSLGDARTAIVKGQWPALDAVAALYT